MSSIVSLSLFTHVELKEDVELTMPVSLIFRVKVILFSDFKNI